MPLNSIAALTVAGLIFLAMARGKTQVLLDLLAQEKGFIKWLLAFAVLLWIYRSTPDKDKSIIAGIIVLAFIGMIIESGDAFAQLRTLFRSI